MKRTGLLALVAVVAVSAGPPRPAPTAAPQPERAWTALATLTYSFDVEANGLPRRTYLPSPSDIDVTYRDLDTGRMVTVRGVDAEWVVTFSDPRFSPAELVAVAHGGGNMWCALEASDATGSGWAMSDRGRHRCSLTRPL